VYVVGMVPPSGISVHQFDEGGLQYVHLSHKGL